MSIISLSGLIAPTQRPFINNHAARAEAELRVLCTKLGILQPNFDEYNTMSAFLFPYADFPRLRAIGLYNNLLYFVDDTFDRHKSDSQHDKAQLATLFETATIMLVDEREVPVSNPIIDTIAEIRRYLIQYAPTEAWYSRFAKNTIEHLLSSLQEVNHELPPYTNSWFDHYNQIRDLDSGMAPTTDLIEFALGHEISHDVYYHEIVAEARLYVTRYCSLSNDIFSYDKEVSLGSDFNAIVMLQRDGYTFENAIEYLIDQLNQMINGFKRIYAYLRSEQSYTSVTNEMLEYMDCLWYQMIAAYHWQFSTNRYRSEASSFVELQNVLSYSN